MARTWLQEAMRPPRRRGQELDLTRATCLMCHTPYLRVHVVNVSGGLEWAPSCNPFIHEVQLDQMVSDVLKNLPQAIQKLSETIPGDQDAEELKLKYSRAEGTEMAEHLRRRR